MNPPITFARWSSGYKIRPVNRSLWVRVSAEVHYSFDFRSAKHEDVSRKSSTIGWGVGVLNLYYRDKNTKSLRRPAASIPFATPSGDIVPTTPSVEGKPVGAEESCMHILPLLVLLSGTGVVCLCIKLHITVDSGPVMLYILSFLYVCVYLLKNST